MDDQRPENDETVSGRMPHGTNQRTRSITKRPIASDSQEKNSLHVGSIEGFSDVAREATIPSSPAQSDRRLNKAQLDIKQTWYG